MNTVEHIVECYFRVCRHCFTMDDVKVSSGNNRQLDLIAISLRDGEQYHVETSVTHCTQWCPDAEKLITQFDRKFFGVPPKRSGAKTDHAKGRNYFAEILAAYRFLGIDESKINRIYCTWIRPDDPALDQRIEVHCSQKGVKPIRVLSFRDDVLPELERTVDTCNYDHHALRTLSLLRQRKRQVERGRANTR